MISPNFFTVKAEPDGVKLWQCPQCGRRFEREGQSHSCRVYALGLHFIGKPAGKLLYTHLRRAVQRRIGFFKIESLECCIHFVSTFTFAAVKIFRDKIQVEFTLTRKLNSKRIDKCLKLSANRYLYVINVKAKEEIDHELIAWIQEAHDKKREQVKTH